MAHHRWLLGPRWALAGSGLCLLALTTSAQAFYFPLIQIPDPPTEVIVPSTGWAGPKARWGDDQQRPTLTTRPTNNNPLVRFTPTNDPGDPGEPIDPGEPVPEVPEPTTLLSGLVGVGALGFYRWFCRRLEVG
jgi:hypothetical protein